MQSIDKVRQSENNLQNRFSVYSYGSKAGLPSSRGAERWQDVRRPLRSTLSYLLMTFTFSLIPGASMQYLHVFNRLLTPEADSLRS